mmetsp:Transcript_30913/g.104107  ORF Transcript_30913/g.104107 Transcript_30913/m.104107 type:complete len:214 (-) Transcript_30913:1192-1833(-)
MVSRAASRQTTQTLRSAEAMLRCDSASTRASGSSGTLSSSLAPPSMAKGGTKAVLAPRRVGLMPSVARPLSMTDWLCTTFCLGTLGVFSFGTFLAVAVALAGSPSSSSSSRPWSLSIWMVSFWKQVGHSGGMPAAAAASSTSATQSRWKACLQEATTHSAAVAICWLQCEHKSKKPAAADAALASASAAGPCTTRYGWSSACRSLARSSKMWA